MLEHLFFFWVIYASKIVQDYYGYLFCTICVWLFLYWLPELQFILFILLNCEEKCHKLSTVKYLEQKLLSFNGYKLFHNKCTDRRTWRLTEILCPKAQKKWRREGQIKRFIKSLKQSCTLKLKHLSSKNEFHLNLKILSSVFLWLVVSPIYQFTDGTNEYRPE